MNFPESELQQACFEWFRLQYPALRKLYFSIPNEGIRTQRNGARLKAQGLTPGVCDSFLSIPVGQWHGLYVEFKAGKNTLTPDQMEFITQVHAFGYDAAVVYDIDAFITRVNNYLKPLWSKQKRT